MKPLRFLPLLLLLPLLGCNKTKVKQLETQLESSEQQRQMLVTQLESVQRTNGDLLARMEDLSVISKEGATSIRESLESISGQTSYIQELNRSIARKDSLNMALVMNLKRSLDNVSDQDVQVEVRGGKVHVSISDKLLFASGSASLNADARRVLEKVGLVLNDHRNLNVIVEGHTDNVPVQLNGIKDNWDLSTRRATAVVRQLVDQFYVDPARLTAAGRAEYDPRGDNATPDGRARNRRTEIVITPNLDEFFDLAKTGNTPG
ncbi:OmpA family protein [Neolewinella lacunae]|uniref:OmpA family protein n=1 Tax=Neolewinella lacunae TaxID=1517758 RepID=A0A923T7D3_9BACT|nr:OmpA family protein [Neolewinella lacunae]MBC6993459.1 OmpA family protein [Neolewinella lacunae]MDN3636265.1 OmpA family protein [Neolewinella lacunae]